MGDILSFRLNARTKRSHYWAGLILLTVATTLLQNVSDGLYWVQMTENAWNLSQVLIILATLVVFCFGVALIVRRLHDIGRSGLWVILLLIVPVLGQIGILILGCLAGSEGANRWGPGWNAPAGETPADQTVRALTELATLKDKGLITDAEFRAQKERILKGQ